MHYTSTSLVKLTCITSGLSCRVDVVASCCVVVHSAILSCSPGSLVLSGNFGFPVVLRQLMRCLFVIYGYLYVCGWDSADIDDPPRCTKKKSVVSLHKKCYSVPSYDHSLRYVFLECCQCNASAILDFISVYTRQRFVAYVHYLSVWRQISANSLVSILQG